MAEGGRDSATLEDENTDNQAKDKISSSVSSNPEKESDFVEVQEWQDNDGNNCTLPLWIKYKRAPDKKIIKCMKSIPCSWNFHLYWNFYTKTEPGKQMLHEILNKYNCSVAVCAEDEDLFIFEISEKIFEQESDVVQLIHVVLDNVHKCAQQFLYLDNILVDQRIQGDVLKVVRQRKELDIARFELIGQQNFDALCVICTEKDQTLVLDVVTEIIHMVKECFENHEEIIDVDHKWQKVMKTFGYLQKLCEKYPSVTIISNETETAIMLKGPRDQSKPAADHFLELLRTVTSEVQEEIFSPGCQFEIFTYPEMCGYIDNITMELSIVWIPNHQTKKIHLFFKKSEKIKSVDKFIRGCVQERLYSLTKDQTVFCTKIIRSLEEFKKMYTGKMVFSSSHKGLLLTATDDIFESIDDAVQEIICKETEDLQSDLVEKHSAMLDQKQREHEAHIRIARMELERAIEISKSKERNHQIRVEELQGEITHREHHIINLKKEIRSLESNISNLKKDIASKEKEIQKVKSDTMVQLKNREEQLLKKYQAELDNLQADHIRESQELVTQFNQAQELLKDKISELQMQSKSCLDTESTAPEEEEIRKVEEASFLTPDGSSVPGAEQLEMNSEDKEVPKVCSSFRTEVTKAVLNIIEDKLGRIGVDALKSALRQVAKVVTSNRKIVVFCDFKQAEEVQKCIFRYYQKATQNKHSVKDSMERHLIEGGNNDIKDLLEFAYGNTDWSKKLEVEGDKLYVFGTLSMKEKAKEAVQTITQWCHEEILLTEDEKQKADEAIHLVRSEFPEIFIKQNNNNDKIMLNVANEDHFVKAKHKIKVALGRVKIRGRKSRSLFPEGESSLSLPQNDRQESSLMSLPSVYQTSQSRAVIASKTYYTREGIEVKVYIGDNVRLPVDCIVNAANKNLSHGGGVALAIAKAAGREFDQESEEYVRNHGIIPVTQCCVTSAGRLPYKYVIHVVGPQWHDYKHNEKDKCGDDLKKTIVNCLIKAMSLKISSIGIPSISSGIFGVPKDVCAQMYVQGVVEFSRTYSLQSDCVKEIHFVDMLPEMCHLTQLAFDNVFSTKSSNATSDNTNLQEDGLAPSAQRYQKAEVKTQNEASATIKPPSYAEVTSKDQGSKPNPYIIKPWDHTSILIYNHDITDVVVDAVVCPVSPKVEGGVVKSLKRAYSVKRECETYVTLPSKANLPLYIHIYSSWWTKPEEQKPGKTLETLIKTSVQNIFNEVKKHQIASVALPILDTGDKTAPMKLICEYIMDGISKVCADPQMAPVGQITIHLVTNETSVANQLKEIACQQFGQKCQVKGETLQTADRCVLLSKQQNLQVTVKNANATSVTQRESCSSHSHSNKGDYENKKETCPICLETPANPRAFTGCGHVLCKECMEHTVKNKPVCPVCGKIYKIITGNQPNGTMEIKTTSYMLLGFKNCGTIEILYSFPDGIQTEGHPNPGQRYYGTSRRAYLPDNTEGRKVLSLLKKAFDRRLVFTVGRSVTRGVENTVTWNGIHHKTNTYGGPENYGYPDADYLKRVQEELAAKGVTEDAI